MVFQRGAPMYVWGHAINGLENAQARLSLGGAEDGGTFAVDKATSTWSATFCRSGDKHNEAWCTDGSTAPLTMKLFATSSGIVQLAQLTDVLIGDVHLVSGQSNVGISVKYSNQVLNYIRIT